MSLLIFLAGGTNKVTDVTVAAAPVRSQFVVTATEPSSPVSIFQILSHTRFGVQHKFPPRKGVATPPGIHVAIENAFVTQHAIELMVLQQQQLQP